MCLPGPSTALREASRFPLGNSGKLSGGIPSALTFQEGGRNTEKMKDPFLLFAPKAQQTNSVLIHVPLWKTLNESPQDFLADGIT